MSNRSRYPLIIALVLGIGAACVLLWRSREQPLHGPLPREAATRATAP